MPAPASWRERPDMATTLTPQRERQAVVEIRPRLADPRRVRRNWLAGLAGLLWLAVIIIPIYWIVITSFKEQSGYYASNPLAPPDSPTLTNYRKVIEADFAQYL